MLNSARQAGIKQHVSKLNFMITLLRIGWRKDKNAIEQSTQTTRKLIRQCGASWELVGSWFGNVCDEAFFFVPQVNLKLILVEYCRGQ